MITEVIILSGGLGTRLRKRVPDLPKTLAPVAGKPFINFIVENLKNQGIQKFYFSLGYMHKTIVESVTSNFPEIDTEYIIEEEPLGTGGAIKNTLQYCKTDHVLVVNGDTMFQVNTFNLLKTHLDSKALCTLALKPMTHYNRYGTVVLSNHQITAFKEKQYTEKGLINGGVYLINRNKFLSLPNEHKFSFETNFLEARVQEGSLSGYVEDGYFIDIGIPEDYEKANIDFLENRIPFEKIDHSWALFLDRDGVINIEIDGNYVNHLHEFELYEGVPEAMQIFHKIFSRIFIVTNQRGVGRGITQKENLDNIHNHFKSFVHTNGGHIDEIYYSPHINSDHPHRKPNPGMGLQAQEDFPDVDFSKSIMIGNNISDMQFGRNLKMQNVFLTTTQPAPALPHLEIDAVYNSLHAFALDLRDKLKLKTPANS